MIASTMNSAGRLIVPPSPGGPAIESGSEKPNTVSKKMLRYSPQPTATAATETPYSRIRVPADDPRDQLAHRRVRVVYALPATGMLDDSSA